MSFVQPFHVPLQQINIELSIFWSASIIFLKGIDDGRKSECKFHLSRYLSLHIALIFNKNR